MMQMVMVKSQRQIVLSDNRPEPPPPVPNLHGNATGEGMPRQTDADLGHARVAIVSLKYQPRKDGKWRIY